MPSRILSTGLTAAALVVLALCGTATLAAAQTETILYSFGGFAGKNPAATLVSDSSGNLYGTASSGGAHKGGTVFELERSTGGGFSLKVLHAFNVSGGDGYSPMASVAFDASGNLFGTTYYGGAHNSGTVFELIPQTGGGWIEEVLYSFDPSTGDGANPHSNVVLDADGNLYGTTTYGGTGGVVGTVFELAHLPLGGWKEKVLHVFYPSGFDGYNPMAGLVFDSAGNLWGTAELGGASELYGTVFEMTRKPGGGWVESDPYSFGDNNSGGAFPLGNLILDAEGNFYGTTVEGGWYGTSGTVFELTPDGGRSWTETELWDGSSTPTDGAAPAAGLTFDGSGNLYGTTVYFGGYGDGGGTVFELSPASGGGWTEQILYQFSLTGADGYNPEAGVILDASGNIYGTTYDGGTYGDGTVFQITR